ncbi:MAG: hypothetical protein ACOCXJ_04080 [Planctomycetota bacterium]
MRSYEPTVVPVSDLALSRRFYIDLFHWEVIDEDVDRCVLAAAGRPRIVLHRTGPTSNTSSIFEQRDAGILILTRQLESIKERLRAKRILFRQLHKRKLQIIDPDQNIITVRQPRSEDAFSTGARGSSLHEREPDNRSSSKHEREHGRRGSSAHERDHGTPANG